MARIVVEMSPSFAALIMDVAGSAWWEKYISDYNAGDFSSG
jgi:hypothetical protein